jgi:hypothetical protein
MIMNANEHSVVQSTLIANPIYDTVFKKLMENMRIAKFFLSTILGEEIAEVTALPQEFTRKKGAGKKSGKKSKKESADIPWSLLRIDFMATVKTEGGKKKKILVEVQKSWEMSDVARFRTYLGEQYAKNVVIDKKETMLPITTIYILGNKLTGIESPCIKIGRVYTDTMKNETIDAKSDFVELLTHDSHVIQASRITDVRYSTNLDKLLSIFEQAYFITANSEVIKEYRYQSDDENMTLITSVLHHMAANAEEREQIEIEERVLRIIEDKAKDKMEEKDVIIKEKDVTIKEITDTIKEKDVTIKEITDTIKEMTDTNKEMAKEIEELKRLLQGKQIE